MLELQNGTYFIASNSGPYYWLSNNGSALTGYYFSYNSVESPKNAAQKSTGELYIIEGNYIQSYDTFGSSLDTWLYPSLNGQIRTFCFSSDENFLFVGGDFTIPYGIAKINSLTGEINNTFDNGTFDKFNDSVYSIVVYGSYLIVTGTFTSYDSNPVSGIAKIDSGDSGYYAVFTTGFDILDNGSGYSNQITSDITNPDLIILYGVFTSFESYSANRIIRIDLSTNTQDTSFVIGTGFDGTVINVTVIDGGLRYLVEGDFTTYDGTSCDSGVIILNYDGSVNQAFNTGYKIIGAVRRDNGILGSYGGYIQYFENNIAYQDVTRSLTFDETTGFAEYSATFGKTFAELLPDEIITKQTLPETTFTGGTVSGATSFTGGLSANTFSATTYLNLPTIASQIGYTPFRYIDTTQSTVTGTLTRTIVASKFIPANTYSSNDVMKVLFKCIKPTTINNMSIRIQINTVNTLTGSVVVGVLTPAAANTYAFMSRNFDLSDGNLYGYNFNSSIASDILASNTVGTSTPFDTTVDNYIFFTVQLNNVADSITYQMSQITN
jgi:hypothetical protein